MPDDIDELYCQLDEMFKYGYTCKKFGETCFKNSTTFSEDLPIFETKDEDDLFEAKEKLIDYIANNLVC